MIRPAVVVLLLALLGFQPGTKGQEIETPKVELYGGYDYVVITPIQGLSAFHLLNRSTPTALVARLCTTRTAGLGWWANSAVIHWCVRGRNTTYQVSYLLGPRVSLRRHIATPFAQVLFGGVWAADGVTLGRVAAFGMTAGGGIDIRFSRYFAVRPLQAEYFVTKFPDGANDRQNNFRFGAGIVLRLGKT